jgi:hypothetical protein
VQVRNQRVVGFFIRPVAHRRAPRLAPQSSSAFTAGAAGFLILMVIAAGRCRSPDSLPKIRDQRKRLSLFRPWPAIDALIQGIHRKRRGRLPH